jgi:hypothetical protein
LRFVQAQRYRNCPVGVYEDMKKTEQKSVLIIADTMKNKKP